MVDSGGRLLAVSVTPANVQDQDGGLALLKRLMRLYPWVETIVVDDRYKKRFIDAVQPGLKRAVDVVLRPQGSKGFVLLPKRWLVEYSIGALTGSRRRKTDYETLLHVSAGALLFASIGLLLASIAMGQLFPNGLSALLVKASVAFADRPETTRVRRARSMHGSFRSPVRTVEVTLGFG